VQSCLDDLLQGKPVAAALVRVFGHQLAELPLVATQYASRRQGHARVLMSAIEGLLAEAGVQTLSLPAAQETVCDSDLCPGNCVRLLIQSVCAS
jgi:ribosomal protein S18 acetylase RimI-like enzyme